MMTITIRAEINCQPQYFTQFSKSFHQVHAKQGVAEGGERPTLRTFPARKWSSGDGLADLAHDCIV